MNISNLPNDNLKIANYQPEDRTEAAGALIQ